MSMEASWKFDGKLMVGYEEIYCTAVQDKCVMIIGQQSIDMSSTHNSILYPIYFSSKLCLLSTSDRLHLNQVEFVVRTVSVRYANPHPTAALEITHGHRSRCGGAQTGHNGESLEDFCW